VTVRRPNDRKRRGLLLHDQRIAVCSGAADSGRRGQHFTDNFWLFVEAKRPSSGHVGVWRYLHACVRSKKRLCCASCFLFVVKAQRVLRDSSAFHDLLLAHLLEFLYFLSFFLSTPGLLCGRVRYGVLYSRFSCSLAPRKRL